MEALEEFLRGEKIICSNNLITIWVHLLCYFILKKLFLFISLFIFGGLSLVFVAACGLSLIAVSQGSSLFAMCQLLIVVASLVKNKLQSIGWEAVALRLSCPTACLIPDQGSNTCPLHWQADSSPLDHQGSSMCYFLHAFSHQHLTKSLEVMYKYRFSC